MDFGNVGFLVGEEVEQIWIWGPLRLVFDSREPQVYADFEGPTFLTAAGTTVPIDFFSGGDRRESSAVLDLLWEKVAAAHIENGALSLQFENGTVLRADPCNDGESWSVVGGGRTLISLPGGDLAST